ncbi:hypothetical protein BDN72DRAFT_905386 [Pluteus cervinus]|uniref:Uncharacterized protein n=1 Tax=Pluteus cervinus TaxID=181527 RepID=A0ACD3A2U1_9AGAR|nr:hypothetical protein BDN72DRAFT_905386 [Pluteus cervinus]
MSTRRVTRLSTRASAASGTVVPAAAPAPAPALPLTTSTSRKRKAQVVVTSDDDDEHVPDERATDSDAEEVASPMQTTPDRVPEELNSSPPSRRVKNRPRRAINTVYDGDDESPTPGASQNILSDMDKALYGTQHLGKQKKTVTKEKGKGKAVVTTTAKNTRKSKKRAKISGKGKGRVVDSDVDMELLDNNNDSDSDDPLLMESSPPATPPRSRPLPKKTHGKKQQLRRRPALDFSITLSGPFTPVPPYQYPKVPSPPSDSSLPPIPGMMEGIKSQNSPPSPTLTEILESANLPLSEAFPRKTKPNPLPSSTPSPPVTSSSSSTSTSTQSISSRPQSQPMEPIDSDSDCPEEEDDIQMPEK